MLQFIFILTQVVFFCFFFSASSSFSFSISATRASISLDSKIWKNKVTLKLKTEALTRHGRWQHITFSGWFLLMTASSMFFPPDWTTWKKPDSVSVQPNAPVSLMVPPEPSLKEPWELNGVFLNFCLTFTSGLLFGFAPGEPTHLDWGS